MIDREKVIKGLEHHSRCRCSFGRDDICPYWSEENDSVKLCRDALALLKDSGQDEGWLCEKRTNDMQTTDLLCACGNKVYFTTLLFKDGFTANELHCPNCGLSMRSPGNDKDGVWLKKNWEEVVLKAQVPRVMTLEEANTFEVVWVEDRSTNTVFPCLVKNNMNDSKLYKHGIQWRIWSARPTEEQREGVKWDGFD